MLSRCLIQPDEDNGKTQSTTPFSSSASAAAHVICLQEVDLADIGRYLERHGYAAVETPRTKGGGAGGRVDSVTCFVYQRDWEILAQQLIRLDDLATLMSDNSVSDGNNESDNIKINGSHNDSERSSASRHVLEGLQQTLLRRNVALLVRIRSKHNPQRTVVIATAHLYWHPGYDYVKLCQAHYVLLRAKAFLQRDDEPFVFCGDLNSKPQGAAYTYLVRGVMNGKLVAPWYHQVQLGDAALNVADGSAEDDDDDIHSLADRMTRELSLSSDDSWNTPFEPRVRYMLDNTLNKLCRWLRILGQDAALESDVEERLRTQEAIFGIFDRCKDERRTLVTSSRRMLSRRDCPPGAYWLSPKLLNDLELALVHLLLTHGVVLDPSKFLSRCVVCNGSIVEVQDAEKKKKILHSYDAPYESVANLEVCECDGCQQGYWWCDQPTSSASRVKNAAINMFELCLRAGVPCSDDLGMFDCVDVNATREQGWDMHRAGSEILQQKLQVVEWLKDQRLACPFQLTSAYRRLEEPVGATINECIPFTNVTDTFVNVLDYIFYNDAIKITHRLSLPTSFKALNPLQVPQGYLLPSDVWPSDHLAIGDTLVFRN